ncbi:MAG: hypothetical protein LBR12_02600 [Opitutaceae bacterium]|jgi:hypothetical protein|nr:hypothetical protein [Opitutaceae bacterium]
MSSKLATSLRVTALLAGGAALLLATGCMSITKSAQTTPIAIVSAQPEIETDLSIDFANPVTGTASVKKLLVIFTLDAPDTYVDGGLPFGVGNVQKAKSGALADALAKGKCDRLVDPQYTVVETGWPFGLYTQYDVTVKGYPATITNIRQVPNAGKVIPSYPVKQ